MLEWVPIGGGWTFLEPAKRVTNAEGRTPSDLDVYLFRARPISSASDSKLRYALEGTIDDTRSFCWATLRQFERRTDYGGRSTSRDFGLQHAEYHMLLGVAQDTMSHVTVIEELLQAIGEPRALPPEDGIRNELREARNLSAVHRDQRVLYWRLTGEHTPHVVKTYKRLGVELPEGTIDKEPSPTAHPQERRKMKSRRDTRASEQ